jgi:hypothetical protein
MDHGRELRLRALALPVALAAAAIVAGASCTRDDPNALIPEGSTGSTTTVGATSSSSGVVGHGGSSSTTSSSSAASSSSSTSGAGGGGAGGGAAALAARVLNYPEALRSASLKLVGDAPPLQDIITLSSATDPKTTYEGMIDAMLADPRFAGRMVEFWQNAFRMREDTAAKQTPSRDPAPVFAARLTFEGGSYMDLLTQTDPTKTCPTYDPTQTDPTKIFADGTCANAASLQAQGLTPVGILTDPGVMALYFGNMAFRRNRFFHETFLCRNATDPAAEPTSMPGPNCPVPGYGSPWNFDSITGLENDPTAGIDFQHAEANGVICANCHATWNHRAPLWANFDISGMYQTTIQVHTPVVGLPFATLADWLPATETTAWKYLVPAPTLQALGTAMAADTELQTCAVARMWNFAMSRGDIVETGNTVPVDVSAPMLMLFQQNQYQLLPLLKALFKGDDFVRF